MKKRILIPLDGSDFSCQILECIRKLFSPEESELIFLRVAQPVAGITAAPALPVYPHMMVRVHESARDAEVAGHPIYASQEKDSLAGVLKDWLEEQTEPLRSAGYTVRVEIRWRDPAQEIVRCIREEGIDVVAMVTHERSGLGRLVLGSVAHEILRTVPVPVMLLHPGC